mmetsp:Transcript_6602/g.14428  ORF Transcript_6602/g.14428 Transcript_6602/m.14428 type:complete len:247 (-) Transcript_6602:65-805(-)
MSTGSVEVNVGGQVFRATAATLRRCPFFASMLGDDLVDNLKDSDGRVFVDRDPQLFYEVLRLLRGYAPRNLPEVPWSSVKAEADYYGVPLDLLSAPVQVVLPPDVLSVRRLYVEAQSTEVLRRDEVCMYSMIDLPPDLKSQTRIVAVEVMRHQGTKTVFVITQQLLQHAGFYEAEVDRFHRWERTERRCYHPIVGGMQLVIPHHPMEISREVEEHYVCVSYAVPPVGPVVTTSNGVVAMLNPRGRS